MHAEVIDGIDDSTEGIIGVSHVRKQKPMYNGLRHYKYQGNGKKIYSCVRVFNCAAEADPGFRVCWFIKKKP